MRMFGHYAPPATPPGYQIPDAGFQIRPPLTS